MDGGKSPFLGSLSLNLQHETTTGGDQVMVAVSRSVCREFACIENTV